MADYDDKQDVEDSEDDQDSDGAILAKARREWRMCQDAESENRNEAKDDLRFLKGGEEQWDPRTVSARKADGRPVITVNTLPTFLHQVTNDQRMNRPSIKVHPVDDNADPETARIEQGMIRHIEYDSNADIAYDRAVNSAAAIGFGFWRLVTEYESESSFNQKICFRSVRNALSVKIDPLSIEPDGSDMQFAFVESLQSKDSFKAENPNAKASTDSLFNDSSYTGWITENAVLVCDYYCIKTTQEDVVLLSNGESGFKADLLQMPAGVSIIKTRKGMRRRVMLYKITAVDILERTEIKCKWIPVFPVYGDEIDIEGKVYRAGIIRNAKGPAKSYNVMMSGATEEVALRGKNPFIGAEGFMESHEEEWAASNVRALPALEYKPTTLDGKLTPPPQRQPMADVPSGMIALAMHAKDNVKATTGLFDASLGARGTATSGKQEIAQQREGDMANYHYMDGLIRTIRHCGRCIACMIPYYYDTERVVRILGEDDTADFARINQPNVMQKPGKDGKIRAFLNDVTVGEYDITVSAGPSYSTLRQEAAEGMADNMAKNPALWGVIGDLYVKNQDWPGADAMAKRLKKTIPPNLIEDEKDEPKQMIETHKGPLAVEQVPQVLMGLDQQLAAAAEAVQKSQADKNAAEVLKQQNAAKELEIKGQEANIKAFEAETARAEAERQDEIDRLKAIAEVEKAVAEQCRIQAESAAKQSESEDGRQQTAKEIVEVVLSNRPPLPSGMTIKSPVSGQTYDVDFRQ